MAAKTDSSAPSISTITSHEAICFDIRMPLTAKQRSLWTRSLSTRRHERDGDESGAVTRGADCMHLIRRKKDELTRVQPDRTTCQRHIKRTFETLDGHLTGYLVRRKRFARGQDHAHHLEVQGLEYCRRFLSWEPVAERTDIDDLPVDGVWKCHVLRCVRCSAGSVSLGLGRAARGKVDSLRPKLANQGPLTVSDTPPRRRALSRSW